MNKRRKVDKLPEVFDAIYIYWIEILFRSLNQMNASSSLAVVEKEDGFFSC